MEITAEYKSNYKSYKKFANLTVKWRKPAFLLLQLYAAFYIVMFAIAFSNGAKNVLPSLIILILIEIITTIYNLFYPRLSYGLTKTSNSVSKKYTFCEDEILVKVFSENMESENKLKYSALKKLYETPEYLFLYVSRRQAFIVDKSTISGGTEEQLRNYLIKAVGDKKYKYYYK